MIIKEFIDTYQIAIIISSIVLVITSITFIWNWQSRRKIRPIVQSMTHQNKNYFNVTIYNNAPYLLKIKKVFKGRIWFFRKQMGFGLTDPNNEHHSDALAKQKKENLFLPDAHQRWFHVYCKLYEDVSEKTFVFKTNAGSCRFKTTKFPKK